MSATLITFGTAPFYRENCRAILALLDLLSRHARNVETFLLVVMAQADNACTIKTVLH